MSDVVDLEFKFAPRPWQKIAGDALAQPGKRAQCLICARRSGKSVYLGAQLVLNALATPNGRYGFFAPSIKQAAGIIASTLKDLISTIPGALFSDGNLAASFPNGATITIHSSTEPDAVRGYAFDGVAIDEAQFMNADAFAAAVRPTLVDRKGWLILSGTPNGPSLLTNTFERVQDDPRWDTQLWPWDEAKAVSAEEVEAARRESPNETIFRQEWCCDMTAGSEFSILPLEDIIAAQNRTAPARLLHDSVLAHFPTVIGVDVGGNGVDGDRSVIATLKGRLMANPIIVPSDQHHTLAHQIARAIYDLNAQTVFIDSGGGYGLSVIQTLEALGLGHKIVPVNFASSPVSDSAKRYHNRRAELYGELAKWLKKGAILPKGLAIQKELAATQFKFNAAGKIQLERKDEVKKRIGGASPDIADAMALCFSHPVYLPDAIPMSTRRPGEDRYHEIGTLSDRRPSRWVPHGAEGNVYDPFS